MQPSSSFSMPVPSFAGGFAPPPPPPSQGGPSYGFRQPTIMAPPQRPVSAVYPGPGGFAAPQPPPPQHQPTLNVTQSFDALSISPPRHGFPPRQSSIVSPQTPRPVSYAGSFSLPPPGPTPAPPPPAPAVSPAPTFAEPAPGPGQPPAIVAPMPTVSTLLAAESKISKPSHIIAWAKAVLSLVDRLQPDADPSNPERIADPVIARLANVAIQHVNSFAGLWPIGSTEPVPLHVAEALYLRGTLEASGAFPEKIPRDQRAAFRDFEAAAKQGYKAGWFKLGRDYESVKDAGHAREVFERGARLKEVSCLYVSVSASTGCNRLIALVAHGYGSSAWAARPPCQPRAGRSSPARSRRVVKCRRPSTCVRLWNARLGRIRPSPASTRSPHPDAPSSDPSQPSPPRV